MFALRMIVPFCLAAVSFLGLSSSEGTAPRVRR